MWPYLQLNTSSQNGIRTKRKASSFSILLNFECWFRNSVWTCFITQTREWRTLVYREGKRIKQTCHEKQRWVFKVKYSWFPSWKERCCPWRYSCGYFKSLLSLKLSCLWLALFIWNQDSQFKKKSLLEGNRDSKYKKLRDKEQKENLPICRREWRVCMQVEILW